MNQKEIQDLIKLVAKQNVAEVKIKDKDFSITIKGKEYFKKNVPVVAPPQELLQAPTTPPAQAPATKDKVSEKTAPKKEKEQEKNNNEITIKSPMVGTFYRKPSPDKEVFVKVGDTINEGDVLCIIEAMKLFNEIESEVSGKIVKVLLDDSTPVEYDQPLFIVEPA